MLAISAELQTGITAFVATLAVFALAFVVTSAWKRMRTPSGQDPAEAGGSEVEGPREG